MLCLERKSPRSKYGRVRLDLFTTAHRLTGEGQEELAHIGERLGVRARATVSPHDAVFEDVPIERVEEFARAVYRGATRLGNYELRRRSAPREIVRMFDEIRRREPARRSA